jgi:hypothetical protein
MRVGVNYLVHIYIHDHAYYLYKFPYFIGPCM